MQQRSLSRFDTYGVFRRFYWAVLVAVSRSSKPASLRADLPLIREGLCVSNGVILKRRLSDLP